MLEKAQHFNVVSRRVEGRQHVTRSCGRHCSCSGRHNCCRRRGGGLCCGLPCCCGHHYVTRWTCRVQTRRMLNILLDWRVVFSRPTPTCCGRHSMDNAAYTIHVRLKPVHREEPMESIQVIGTLHPHSARQNVQILGAARESHLIFEESVEVHTCQSHPWRQPTDSQRRMSGKPKSHFHTSHFLYQAGKENTSFAISIKPRWSWWYDPFH